MGRQFNTDCEGPISKNDNAMELVEHYIPGGRQVFAVVSRYDDFLADVEKRPGYKAGDTLRLILPFLKAFGVTDAEMTSFSRNHLLLLPRAAETLREISARMESFIISTSYAPYIRALCDAVGFSMDRTYCTAVSLDRHVLGDGERERLASLAEEIRGMAMMDWAEGSRSLGELGPRDRGTIRRLDEIFWSEVRGMTAGRLIDEVNPVGGREKAAAILHSLSRTGNRLDGVFYAGDSITDAEAFALVRRGGGLALSFNGNRYALREAEVACLSDDTRVIATLALAFEEGGRAAVLDLVDRWEVRGKAGKAPEGGALSDAAEAFRGAELNRVTEENRPWLTARSEAFRKTVRGVSVGALG
jgi:energy-converting hydrogenase A subunit R